MHIGMLKNGMVRAEIFLPPRAQAQALGLKYRRLKHCLLLAERKAAETLVEARHLAAGVEHLATATGPRRV